MAWVTLNDNYAANDETATVVRRTVCTTGFTDDTYAVCDDPLTKASNHGVEYASLDDRISAGIRGGVTRVAFPMGMDYEDVVDAIRIYGRV